MRTNRAVCTWPRSPARSIPSSSNPISPTTPRRCWNATEHGECVFFERESRLCVVHRDLGHDALPATCRHFPRLAVRDVRGTFVGLSHYCPTAAEMLFRDDVSLTIVAAPEAFPPADYEGLSVTPDDLPPLLRPGVVMDLEAYTRWEAHMVRRCAEAATPESALATLERDAMRVRAWTPDGPAMSDLVDALPAALVEAAPWCRASPRASRPSRRRWPRCRTTCGPRRTNTASRSAFERFVAPAWRSWSRPLRQYLAAKAFASWTAYQGRGLLSIVRGLAGGAGARACGSGAGVPRRGAAARPRAAARGLPSGRFHPEPPGRGRGPGAGVVRSGG